MSEPITSKEMFDQIVSDIENGNIDGITKEEIRAVEQLERLTANIFSRSQLARSRNTNSNRDYYKEAQWPAQGSVQPEHYFDYYCYHIYARRALTVMPNSCWATTPSIKENNKSEDTEFEKAWKNIDTKLNRNYTDSKETRFKNEKGSVIWSYLKRADILSRIGRFGVIVLGINDGNKLSEPLEGFLDPDDADYGIQDGVELLDDYIQDDQSVREDGTGEDDLDDLDQYEDEIKRDDEGGGPTLDFIRVFSENEVTVTSWNTDRNDPRYDEPLMYQVRYDESSSQTPDHSGRVVGAKQRERATFHVHWSRVIHVAELDTSSEVYARPLLEPAVPQLENITKMFAGEGEGHWRTAVPTLVAKVAAEDIFKGNIDRDSVKKAMRDYVDGLKRFLGAEGFDIDAIQSSSIAGTEQIKNSVEALCVLLECPMRIFMGSERGELASSQDRSEWQEKSDGRKETHLVPNIIAPFVERLIDAGVLPPPQDGFYVDWEKKDVQTPAERMEQATLLLDAIARYMESGAYKIITPRDLFVKVIGMDEETVDAIVKSAANPEKEDKKLITELDRNNSTDSEV